MDRDDVPREVLPIPDRKPVGLTTIAWVLIDIDAAAKDVDHLIGAEKRFQLAMTRQ